ncbi:MAG TPA: signal peptidase I [Holophagaceae bacterium]|nr:signal peptidase I [Holophagaceae bacterium]
MSKKIDERELPPGVRKGFLRDNLEVILFAMVVVFFMKTFVAQNFTIPSASMRNSLMIGDHLLANKFIFATPQWGWESTLFPMRKVERGDIIVFRWPYDRDQDWVKRCAALPGDTLELRNRHLYINGKLVTGDFEHHFGNIREVGPTPGPWPIGRDMGEVVHPTGLWRFADPEVVALPKQGRTDLTEDGSFMDNLGPITVPPGHVFAMGDNRENSADSRYWGFLPMDHLRGRPFMVWWSYREGGDDNEKANVPSGPGDVLANYVDAARYFLVRTRWERTGLIPK